MKKLKALAVLALAAGALFVFCAFFFGLPADTYIDGVYVGGKSCKQAIAAVRGHTAENLKNKSLVICAGEDTYTFRYPEFNFSDDLDGLVKNIRKKGGYSSHSRVYLSGKERITDAICSQRESALVEPYVLFNGKSFEYFEGSDGVSCDRAALARDIDKSLNSDFSPVTLKIKTARRKTTVAQLAARTKKLSSFSTFFDSSNSPRSHNIALASSGISGTVLNPGESFSFNSVVGPRTAARGFKKAKIISGGKFVEGMGGGVCQVSTTLYNAAVLAGLEVTEYHPHSLGVSYVAPSRDAMVSGDYFDLKFKNCTPAPVYIGLNVSGGRVTAAVFGLPDGVKRKFESVTLESPEGEECTLSEGYLVEEGKEGTVRRLIRTDRYALPERE